MLTHEDPNCLEREIQNRWADGYDAIFYQRPAGIGNLQDFREFLDRRIKERFGHLSIVERQRLRILDAGCGTGQLLSQWRAALDANTVGLPRPAVSGIRVYERYFYLSPPTLLTP